MRKRQTIFPNFLKMRTFSYFLANNSPILTKYSHFEKIGGKKSVVFSKFSYDFCQCSRVYIALGHTQNIFCYPCSALSAQKAPLWAIFSPSRPAELFFPNFGRSGLFFQLLRLWLWRHIKTRRDCYSSKRTKRTTGPCSTHHSRVLTWWSLLWGDYHLTSPCAVYTLI